MAARYVEEQELSKSDKMGAPNAKIRALAMDSIVMCMSDENRDKFYALMREERIKIEKP